MGSRNKSLRINSGITTETKQYENKLFHPDAGTPFFRRLQHLKQAGE